MSRETGFTINKYLPLACIYFFFNSLFLPEGLLYTTFLTPLFFFQIVEQKKLKYLIFFVSYISIFFIVHLTLGINITHYLISYILFTSVGIFCICFYSFCRNIQSFETLFINILYINTILIPIALLSLKFNIFKAYFWYLRPISPDLPVIPRLKMFSYEASYYSLLLVPIVFYVIWKLIFNLNKLNVFHLLLVIIPLGLSFSLGVIMGIVISMFLLILFYSKSLFNNRRVAIISLVMILVLIGGFAFLYKYFPDNPLITRIKNISTGRDTSARGRTYEAFQIAVLIAKEKSLWFGVGLGQIKDVGRGIISNFYQYMNMPGTVRIPNAVAETFAIYGIIGLIIRFWLIIYLFIKTKVSSNYFRLSLFLFVFIYQFTGSYLFNIVEFVIWILAFSFIFPQFNRKEILHE